MNMIVLLLLSKIMIQSGGATCDIPIFGNLLSTVGKKQTDIGTSLGEYFLDKQTEKFNKVYVTGKTSETTLRNNEIKDIVKLIKPLENRGIFLKDNARKITSQEGEFFNFLRPLMTAGLPLMKSVLKLLAKIVMLPFGLLAAMSAKDAAI